MYVMLTIKHQVSIWAGPREMVYLHLLGCGAGRGWKGGDGVESQPFSTGGSVRPCELRVVRGNPGLEKSCI